MSDADILAAIHSKFTDYVKDGDGTVYFTGGVFKGPPEALTPFNRSVMWHVARTGAPPEGAKTLSNVMRLDIFEAKCFWQRSALAEARETNEDDLYILSHDLPGAFWGDATLGGFVSDLDIFNVRYDLEAWPQNSDTLWRTLTFEIHVKVLEGETISA